MKSAVTISLVPEAKGGPFVYWDGLANGCTAAAELGFDAVEIFPPSTASVEPTSLKALLQGHGLKLAAMGTGGGWVIHKWTLTHADPVIRKQAREFIREMIKLAGGLSAPAIIGSLQGRWDAAVSRPQALEWLAEALEDLGAEAERQGVPLLYEPLNRYETNLFCRTGETAQWLQSLRTKNIRILADLFHMNIEESNVPGALQEAGPMIGHVHFADSNRWAIGGGHTRVAPIIAALQEISYDGYLSAEVLPLPDSQTAARQTISAFQQTLA